jgi:phage terminase large subunit
MAKVKLDLSFMNEVTNKIYQPLYDNTNRYLVLWGGGSSGKSYFAAEKIIYRMMVETPHKILCVRKVGKTLRDSMFAELKRVCHEWGVAKLFKFPKGVTSELYIQCRANGNEIIFVGLDDVEKIKSIVGITSMWIEEPTELSLEEFSQLDIRMRGETKNYKQIILTFNPIYITHWLKGEFFNLEHPKANTTSCHSTYHNNKFLDDASREVLEGFKLTDPYYYAVYCLGQWGILGKTIFDSQKVTERLVYLQYRKPLKEGFFAYEYENEKIIDKTIKWIDEAGGYIRIYEDKKQGYPYVIGGDTAGEGSDYFTGHVVNNVSSMQCAVLRQQFDEDLYAKQMYCLGKYYNEALIGIETNFSTYPVKELTRLGYYRQFVREIEDKITKKRRASYGFNTNKLSRPVIISNLVQLVREYPELFNDIPTLEEMLTFVRNENGKAEAQDGKTDDLIMGLAIAYYCQDQQDRTAVIDSKEKAWDWSAPTESADAWRGGTPDKSYINFGS